MLATCFPRALPLAPAHPPPSRRRPQNAAGGKMYIQDKVEEYSDEVFDLLNNGPTYISVV